MYRRVPVTVKNTFRKLTGNYKDHKQLRERGRNFQKAFRGVRNLGHSIADKGLVEAILAKRDKSGRSFMSQLQEDSGRSKWARNESRPGVWENEEFRDFRWFNREMEAEQLRRVNKEEDAEEWADVEDEFGTARTRAELRQVMRGLNDAGEKGERGRNSKGRKRVDNEFRGEELGCQSRSQRHRNGQSESEKYKTTNETENAQKQSKKHKKSAKPVSSENAFNSHSRETTRPKYLFQRKVKKVKIKLREEGQKKSKKQLLEEVKELSNMGALGRSQGHGKMDLGSWHSQNDQKKLRNETGSKSRFLFSGNKHHKYAQSSQEGRAGDRSQSD